MQPQQPQGQPNTTASPTLPQAVMPAAPIAQPVPSAHQPAGSPPAAPAHATAASPMTDHTNQWHDRLAKLLQTTANDPQSRVAQFAALKQDYQLATYGSKPDSQRAHQDGV